MAFRSFARRLSAGFNKVKGLSLNYGSGSTRLRGTSDVPAATNNAA